MAALLSLLSSIMWGSSDFLGGLYSRRLPAMAVYGVSQGLALVVLAVAAIVTSAWQADLGYIPWAVVSSLLGMVGMLAFYRALAMGPMGIISPLVALSVIVPVAYGLLSGEVPNAVQMVGILIAVVGILLASGPELGGAETAKPLLLAVIALACFGGMYITLARGAESSAVMMTFTMRVTSVLILGVVAIIVRSVGGVSRSDLPGLAVLGVLDAGANIAYGWATTQGLMTTTAVLGSLYPVVTAILAALVLRERLRPVQYIGVGATFVAIAMISAA